ncbi:MAG: hypothetical protein KDJ65_29695 [Anaerolineae bacterium]|nr:hypothetical protein [Anaerolineae bacterium]
MKITWADLLELGEEIFFIWTGTSELKWAETAWQKLEEQGFTSYKDDLQKHIVLLRFFILGVMYREFFQMAFDEPADLDVSYWLDILEGEGLYLSPFRLGQLADNQYRIDEALDAETVQELLPSIVSDLMEEQRDIVFSGLKVGFGSESLLFAHLWLSARSYDDDDDDDDEPRETVEEILASVTYDKMPAFRWVNERMPSL